MKPETGQNQAYWIMLAAAAGTGSPLVPRIVYSYGSARAFFEAGPGDWKQSGLFTPQRLLSFEKASFESAAKIIKQCDYHGYKIITPDSPEYPERLKRTNDFPAVLYIKGELPPIDDEAAIAMVGTRSASNYGSKVAHVIGTGLAQGGALVISGGAVGIDAISHKAAIMAGGKTVAVLGCGFNFKYLMQNADLREAISKNGALVSEYPPDFPAGRSTFPIRNRIISGLSLGVVVIEAGGKSGSLITAEHALQQGRDVFATPGSVISPAFEGTNRLLRDGAKPVFSAVDILEEYTNIYPHRINLQALTKIKEDSGKGRSNNDPADIQETEGKTIEKRQKPEKIEGVSKEAKRVFDILTYEPLLFDELLAKTDFDTMTLARALTELELNGRAEVLAGSKYHLK